MLFEEEWLLESGASAKACRTRKQAASNVWLALSPFQFLESDTLQRLCLWFTASIVDRGHKIRQWVRGKKKKRRNVGKRERTARVRLLPWQNQPQKYCKTLYCATPTFFNHPPRLPKMHFATSGAVRTLYSNQYNDSSYVAFSCQLTSRLDLLHFSDGS